MKEKKKQRDASRTADVVINSLSEPGPTMPEETPLVVLKFEQSTHLFHAHDLPLFAKIRQISRDGNVSGTVIKYEDTEQKWNKLMILTGHDKQLSNYEPAWSVENTQFSRLRNCWYSDDV
jgi:hypothetical protein